MTQATLKRTGRMVKFLDIMIGCVFFYNKRFWTRSDYKIAIELKGTEWRDGIAADFLLDMEDELMEVVEVEIKEIKSVADNKKEILIKIRDDFNQRYAHEPVKLVLTEFGLEVDGKESAFIRKYTLLLSKDFQKAVDEIAEKYNVKLERSGDVMNIFDGEV